MNIHITQNVIGAIALVALIVAPMLSRRLQETKEGLGYYVAVLLMTAQMWQWILWATEKVWE